MTLISMPPEPLTMLMQRERGKMAGVGTRGHITPAYSNIHRRGNCKIHTQPGTQAHGHGVKGDRRKIEERKTERRGASHVFI